MKFLTAFLVAVVVGPLTGKLNHLFYSRLKTTIIFLNTLRLLLFTQSTYEFYDYLRILSISLKSVAKSQTKLKLLAEYIHILNSQD